MSYYQKYLKYKSKYLHLINLLGGGKVTAKKMFLDGFNDKVKKIVMDDRERGLLKFDGEPSKDNKELLENIFEQIYTKVNQDNEYIDWIIRNYNQNTFGDPSSLANFERFKEAISKYKILKDHKIKVTQIDQIKGLLKLEEYINHYIEYEYFKCYEIKKAKQERTAAIQRKEEPIRAAGVDDKKEILKTDKVIIYVPTTEAGSKLYGMNTKWCTTSIEDCQFNFYNDQGNLYIIQSLSKPKLKFQLHVENGILNDSEDDEVTIDDVKAVFKDQLLNKWFDEIWEKELIEHASKGKKELIIHNNYTLFDIDSSKVKILLNKVLNLKSLIFGRRLNLQLGDSLKGFTNLELLTFGDDFNNSGQPLGNSLNNLTNLQSLTFGVSFSNDDQPLGNSLNNLTKLQSLNLGGQFNKPLGDSLNNLTNLQSLTFGDKFNNDDQPLGTSLNNLTNLQSLTFGTHFNQLLGTLLNNFTKLQFLEFGHYFNKPIGNSLQKLTELKSLTFGSQFDNDNRPLYTSLNNLTKLQSLTLGGQFNSRLGTSFQNLTNLQSLTFSYAFNYQLDDSLKYLTNLRFLKFGYDFDKPLGDSLKDLINLESLDLNNFNYPLGDSLKSLTKLQSLTFDNFNYPLGDSLKSLSNLNSLILGSNFNKTLGDSLTGLSNLRSLTFGYNFNNDGQTLGDSLKSLSNLEILKFGHVFNQPLGNSLKALTNVKELYFDFYFNNGGQPLGDSLKGLTSLEDIRFGNNFTSGKLFIGDSLTGLPNLRLVNGIEYP